MTDILLMIYERKNFGMIEVYLDGGRKYGKTYRVCDTTAKALIIAPYDVDAYMLRWQKQDSNELAGETIDAVERYFGRDLTKNDYNKQEKTFRINGNVLRVLGLHTPSQRKKVKLTGIKRAKNKKYAIIVFEEAYEFSEKELDQVLEAIGGYQNYLIFYITNPNSLAIPFIKQREREFPHNERLLRERGFQYKYQKIDNKRHKIWFYANWRVNEYLPEADYRLIMKSWETDANRARVVDYGMPGVEEGGIYTHEIPKIKTLPLNQILQIPLKSISAGVDWGDGVSETASATTLVISAVGYNEETYVLETYKHQNHWDGYKSPQERVADMLEIIYQFSLKRSDITYQPFNVYLDTGLVSEMEFFKLGALNRGLDWINFSFATKYQERTRINMRKYRMNTGRYYIANHITNIQEELQLQTWDEDKKDKFGQPKQKDEHNHLTDAEDYALCEYTYSITQEEQFRMLYKKW